METVPEKRIATDDKATCHPIQECHADQIRANEHVFTHIRQLIARRAGFYFPNEQTEVARKTRQLERAFELNKESEAKIQILITWLGREI
jgi:hypothetical protein